MFVLTGLLLLATALWFAASWVDTAGGDSTCGSVLRPTLWSGETAPNSCSPVMPVRAAIAAATAAAGLVSGWIGVSRRRIVSSNAAMLVLATAIVGATILLVVNEMVRSDGGL
ncbi:MAG TPA: hypothetical protein VFV32_12130 [Acidimicrobiales bacterium]|nr:hypothetical protein [Acidimicrobiales bacterium]